MGWCADWGSGIPSSLRWQGLAAMAFAGVLGGCGESTQYDYPVAVGTFLGTLSDPTQPPLSSQAEPEGSRGLFIMEVGKSIRVDSVDVILNSTDDGPAYVMYFEGPLAVDGLEARTFSSEVTIQETTWDLTGSFLVRASEPGTAEATLCSGELVEPTSGLRLTFSAEFQVPEGEEESAE